MREAAGVVCRPATGEASAGTSPRGCTSLRRTQSAEFVGCLGFSSFGLRRVDRTVAESTCRRFERDALRGGRQFCSSARLGTAKDLFGDGLFAATSTGDPLQ